MRNCAIIHPLHLELETALYALTLFPFLRILKFFFFCSRNREY